MTGPISDYGYPSPYGPHYGPQTPRLRTSVAGLGYAMIVLLSLQGTLTALACGFLIWRRSLLGKFLNNPASVDPAGLSDSDHATVQAMGWFTILTLGSIVVFLCWFWAARKNAEVFLPGHGSLKPGWSIGGWFVPFGCFVLPFLVARDIYRGTMAGPDRPPRGGAITGWWWAAFLAFLAGGFMVDLRAVIARDATDPVSYVRDLQTSATFGIIALVIGTVAAALAIAYVRVITKAQNARMQSAWQQGPYMPYGYGAPVQDAVPDGWPQG